MGDWSYKEKGLCQAEAWQILNNNSYFFHLRSWLYSNNILFRNGVNHASSGSIPLSRSRQTSVVDSSLKRTLEKAFLTCSDSHVALHPNSQVTAAVITPNSVELPVEPAEGRWTVICLSVLLNISDRYSFFYWNYLIGCYDLVLADSWSINYIDIFWCKWILCIGSWNSMMYLDFDTRYNWTAKLHTFTTVWAYFFDIYWSNCLISGRKPFFSLSNM